MIAKPDPFERMPEINIQEWGVFAFRADVEALWLSWSTF
jgi:hypothetical protein